MKITDIITENINFYDRFGHDTGAQTLPYTVEVRDRETGGKKLISIEAVSTADARERARDRGYRVVRVVSQDGSGRKGVREHDGRDDEEEEIDDDGLTMADRARRDGRGSDDEPETAAQRRRRSLQATRDFNRGRRADSMREGVAEGSSKLPVCKHCGKRQGEHRRGECPKGSKTAVGYTDYGPTKFEPKDPKKPGVAEGIRVIDQDYDLDQIILTLDIEGRRASFTYTDYDENFENAERKDVFDQLQEKSWYKGLDHPTKMEILDAAYKAIRGEEPSEYKPRVDDEPLDIDEGAEEDPSEEEMDRTVSDLHKDVFGIRPSPEWGREWMSMSEQEKRDLYYQMVDMLDQQQDMSEGYGTREFEVDGYTYMTDLDREEDNQKIWHMIKTPDGKTVNVDFTPYEYMTKDDVELYVKLGMPKRQGAGPLDSEQLQKMAQIKGVAMLDPKMARAGM